MKEKKLALSQFSNEEIFRESGKRRAALRKKPTGGKRPGAGRKRKILPIAIAEPPAATIPNP